MESEKSNIFARPHKDLVPLYEALNRPFLPSWSTSMQAYNFPGFTPTARSNPFGPYHYPSWWGSLQVETWSNPLQYDSLRDPWRPSIYPATSTGVALASSERVQSLLSGKNPDSMKTPDENLQAKSLLTKESIENGKRPSIPETNWEGVQLSLASGCMGSPHEGHDANNDFPSTKMQQCDMAPGNGEDAQKVTTTENGDDVLQNGSSSAANPTELNQNLETGLNAPDTNPEPENLEDEEERRARKREANREPCRRTRMKKKKEYEELNKKVDNLRDENEELRKKLLRLSEECLEITNENDSTLEELVEKYGADTIADLSKQILPDSVGGES